jgi:hypothetical protein
MTSLQEYEIRAVPHSGFLHRVLILHAVQLRKASQESEEKIKLVMTYRAQWLSRVLQTLGWAQQRLPQQQTPR